MTEGLLPGLVGHRAVRRTADPVMMPGVAALAKKGKVLDEVKEVMEESALIFCVRTEGVEVNELNGLRQTLPDEIKMRCVKNNLLRLAAEEIPRFKSEQLPELLHYSNYWFFVPEDKMRDSVKIWNDWTEANKKQNEIIGGVFDGQVLDADGIDRVSKLPTKQELMGQTAGLLKAMPTKLARLIKQAGAERLARGVQEARGSKMARAVKLASEKMSS